MSYIADEGMTFVSDDYNHFMLVISFNIITTANYVLLSAV